MNQKGIIILFFILALVGLVAAGYSKFKEGLNLKPEANSSAKSELNLSSSPSPSEITLSLGQNNNLGSANVEPTFLVGVEKGQVKTTTITVGGKQVRQYSNFPGEYSKEQLKDKGAVIETAKGKIVIGVFTDNPKAASNFLFLASQAFYDGLTFHRLEPGFVIQGGDPLADGTGGPGYTFREEPMVKGSYNRGMVAMAKRSNEPAGTFGSQFFIMLANNPLPPDYVIFGRVIQGEEVLDKIQVGEVMSKVSVVRIVIASASASSNH